MMPTARSHGRPYVEAPRHDELPAGEAAPVQVEAGHERRADGTLAQGARTIPSLGGKAMKGRTKLSHRIQASKGLREPYVTQARTLRRALCSEYARTVGGGTCGVGPSLLLKLAAEATALADQALEDGDGAAHRSNADAVKMLLAYAREDCAKQAASRPKGPIDPLARWRTPPKEKP
jgi:hypothetical protein